MTSRPCRACGTTDCWCVGCGRPCWLPCRTRTDRPGEPYLHERLSKAEQVERSEASARRLGVPRFVWP